MLSDKAIKELFPTFEPELIEDIINNASLKYIHEGDVLMKTGQYFRSVIIVVSGLIKIFREDEEGNELRLM